MTFQEAFIRDKEHQLRKDFFAAALNGLQHETPATHKFHTVQNLIRNVPMKRSEITHLLLTTKFAAALAASLAFLWRHLLPGC